MRRVFALVQRELSLCPESCSNKGSSPKQPTSFEAVPLFWEVGRSQIRMRSPAEAPEWWGNLWIHQRTAKELSTILLPYAVTRTCFHHLVCHDWLEEFSVFTLVLLDFLLLFFLLLLQQTLPQVLIAFVSEVFISYNLQSPDNLVLYSSLNLPRTRIIHTTNKSSARKENQSFLDLSFLNIWNLLIDWSLNPRTVRDCPDLRDWVLNYAQLCDTLPNFWSCYYHFFTFWYGSLLALLQLLDRRI